MKLTILQKFKKSFLVNKKVFDLIMIFWQYKTLNFSFYMCVYILYIDRGTHAHIIYKQTK